MNKPYTKEELNRSLEFIEERLSLQRESTSLLKDAIYKAVLAIILLSRKYKIEPKKFKFSLNKTLNKEVDVIISNLIDEVLGNIRELATYGTINDEDEYNLALLWVNTRTNESTITKRITTYTHRLKNEIEVAVAASLLLNKTPQETANIVKTNLHAPFGSILIKTAKEEDLNSYATLVTSYGIGRYSSSFNNINRASIDTIARSRQQLFYLREELNGADSWYVIRGSSYPCSLCDANVGIHKSSFDLPPYHPNCVCMAIPLNTYKK